MGRYMKPEEPGAEPIALAAGLRKLLVCLLERVCWGSSSQVRVSLPAADCTQHPQLCTADS